MKEVAVGVEGLAPRNHSVLEDREVLTAWEYLCLGRTILGLI